MTRAITSSLALFAILFLVGCDGKPVGVLEFDIISSDEQGTYRADGDGEGVSPVLSDGEGVKYALYTMYRMDTFDFKGEGSFKELQGKQDQPTEHKPGDPTDGLDILYYFYKASDGRFIIRQVMNGMTLEGAVDMDIMAEVEFTEGTWENYLAGDTVSVTFTEAGLDEYYTVAEEQAIELIQMIGESQDANLRTEFEIEWGNRPNYLFEVSLKELNYKAQADSNLKMVMTAYKK